MAAGLRSPNEDPVTRTVALMGSDAPCVAELMVAVAQGPRSFHEGANASRGISLPFARRRVPADSDVELHIWNVEDLVPQRGRRDGHHGLTTVPTTFRDASAVIICVPVDQLHELGGCLDFLDTVSGLHERNTWQRHWKPRFYVVLARSETLEHDHRSQDAAATARTHVDGVLKARHVDAWVRLVSVKQHSGIEELANELTYGPDGRGVPRQGGVRLPATHPPPPHEAEPDARRRRSWPVGCVIS